MGVVDDNLVGDDGGVSAGSTGLSWGGGEVEIFLRRAGAMLLARCVFVIVVGGFGLGNRRRDTDRNNAQLVKSASRL